MTSLTRTWSDERVSSSTGARVITGGLWALRIGSAAVFLMAGVSKLSGVPMMVQMFDAIGVGQWFRYVTGVIEVVGAVLLLVPSAAAGGAAALAVTRVGAVITHVFIVGGSPVVPILLLASTTTIAWVKRGDR